jgi:hypothetical protein
VTDPDDGARTDPPSPPVDRRTLDEIFGDVLPTVTQDEMADGDERSSDADRERWYRDNRPPHHG